MTSAASGVLGTAANGASTAANVSNFRAARTAAANATRLAIPNASRATVTAASNAAARQAALGSSRQVTRLAVRQAAGPGAQVAGTAARAALRHGGTTVARAAGRFVPGANVAIAALDVATAASTFRNPSSTTGQRVTAGITALGSIAAATNIPFVSQGGAIVSTASSLIGSFLGN